MLLVDAAQQRLAVQPDQRDRSLQFVRYAADELGPQPVQVRFAREIAPQKHDPGGKNQQDSRDRSAVYAKVALRGVGEIQGAGKLRAQRVLHPIGVEGESRDPAVALVRVEDSAAAKGIAVDLTLAERAGRPELLVQLAGKLESIEIRSFPLRIKLRQEVFSLIGR